VILVDTSVIIDKLRKIENQKTVLFDRLNNAKTPYGISIFTFHEILQGAKSEPEFKKLYEYFSTQKIFSLSNTIEIYTKSAGFCFDMRRQGLTIRNTIDVLIAYTAIHYNLPLLHNDRDFDFIAEKTPKLKILN